MFGRCVFVVSAICLLAFLVGCTPSVDTTPGTGKVVDKDDIKTMEQPQKPPTPK